jgi:lysophospholipase L1-like esterase
LAQTIGATPVLLADGGDKIENTVWVVDQIDPAAARRVRTIVASVGTANLRDRDPCAFDVKAEALAAHLRRKFPHGSIFMIGLYQKGPFGENLKAQVAAANKSLQQAAASIGATYVDVYEPLARACVGQENCTMFEPNRVHPSLAGYVVISNALRLAMGK